jgi:hypothetical protein
MRKSVTSKFDATYIASNKKNISLETKRNKINVDPLKNHFCAIEIGTNKVCQDPLVPRPVLFYDLFNWQVGVSN